jgi:septum formation protein
MTKTSWQFPLIYLASNSPRRRELLTRAGIPFNRLLFRTDARADPEIDETPYSGEAAADYAQRIAHAKAKYGLSLIKLRHLPPRPVLAADTTLELDGDIIGKPQDTADARAILKRLSGQTHRVLTCVALATPAGIREVLDVSRVFFRVLRATEIDHYIASGEAMDKAGAYGIQGMAGLFIERIEGSDTGVMGLPLCATGKLLLSATSETP